MPAALEADGSEPDGSELERLRLEVARLRGQVDLLKVQLEARIGAETRQRDVVADQARQLAERDELIERERDERRRMEQSFRETDRWREENEAELKRGIESLRSELEQIKSTRLWRIGGRYWSAKEHVRGRQDSS